MTHEAMWLTLLATALTGMVHLVGKDVSWCRTLRPAVRILLANALGIPLALIVSRLSGSEWLVAGYQALLVVGVPTLLGLTSYLGGSDKPPVPVEAPNPPSVSTTAGTVLLVLLLGGCAGSLETGRAAAMAPRLTSVAGVPMRAVDPGRCETLDNRYVAFGATAIVAGSLAAATGIPAIPVKDDDAKTVLIGSAIGLAAVGAASEFVSQQAASRWASECAVP